MVGPVVGRAEVDVHADLSPFRRELNAAAARAGRDYGNTFVRNLDTRLQRTTRIFDKFWGSTLRGSRNDFLNFVGVVSAGMERLVGNVIGRGLGTIANGFDRLGVAIARFPSLVQFAGGFRLVASNIRSLGAGGIDGLIVQIIALVAAFNIGTATFGFVAAGISTLTAGVTALAVGIGGALFGGIVALIPVVGALGAGIGALTLAFTDLTKSQKAAFRPLGDLLSELRRGVQDRLFDDLSGQVDGLVKALRPLGPFLNSVADEFSDWVSQIVEEIGPGGPLADTFESLGQSLPQTFGRLLDLLSNLSGSLIGLFDAATPAADRLLDSMNNVLGRFNEWVNSVDGQEAINDFLQKALDLLESLFDIAGEVGEALSNLWTAGGADAAEQLLESIRQIVEDFNTWVSDEGGREALLRWFEDGVEAVKSLGGVMKSLLELFDSLDTAFTRLGFKTFLDFLAEAIRFLSDMATLVQENTIAVSVFFRDLADDVETALEDIETAASDLWDGLVLGFGLVVFAGQEFVEFLNGLGNPMEAAAQSGRDLRADLVKAFKAMGDAIANFVERAGRFLRDLRNPMELAAQSGRELRADIAAAFSRIASSIRDAMSRAASSVSNFVSRASAAFDRFVSNIGRGVNQAISAIQRFALRGAAAIGGLPGKFLAIGINMMAGLSQGIVSRGESILAYLRGLASRAAAAFASVLAIGSPSKVFAEFGRNIVEGLVEGLNSGIGDVLSATNSLAGAAAFPALNAPVSALATQASGFTSNSGTARSVTDIGGITVVTPYANPRLVALEVMDELAARGK